VHYLELDQFIGPNYLVTVHGPLNPAVDPELALRETGAEDLLDQFGRVRGVADGENHFLLAVVLIVMAAVSATLLRWARRQGWW
jgi:hypothetical protein